MERVKSVSFVAKGNRRNTHLVVSDPKGLSAVDANRRIVALQKAFPNGIQTDFKH